MFEILRMLDEGAPLTYLLVVKNETYRVLESYRSGKKTFTFFDSQKDYK